MENREGMTATIDRTDTDERERLQVDIDRLREDRSRLDSAIRDLESEARSRGVDVSSPELSESHQGVIDIDRRIELGDDTAMTCKSIAGDGCHLFDVEHGGKVVIQSKGVGIDQVPERARFLDDVCKSIGEEHREAVKKLLNRFAIQWRAGEKQTDDPEAKLKDLLDQAGVTAAKTIRELLDSDTRHEYIIDGIFAAGMTAVIAGASKGMKTSIAVDMALSLVLGRSFLGRFKVPTPQRVLMFSVESGEASIKETAQRVIKAKGLPDDLLEDQMRIHGEWIPASGSDTDAAILRAMIIAWRITVVILDPTYFICDGDNQANINHQGQELRAIAKIITDAGATPVFVDHIKLSSNNSREHQPLELADLSGAGKSAFFRQWLLLSRREKFDPNVPIHRLWMSFGGNHGRHGTWGVDIDESRDDGDQRIWDVELKDHTEIKREADQQRAERAAEREAEKEAKREATIDQHCKRLRFEYMTAGTAGLVKKHAFAGARLSNEKGGFALERLLLMGDVEPCEVTYRDGRRGPGHRWVENRENSNADSGDKSDKNCGQSGLSAVEQVGQDNNTL